MKSIFTFLATFVLGALLALAARTSLHDPHASHDTAGATTTRGDYAPMVNNAPPAPTASPTAPASPSAHSSHPKSAPAATTARPGTPVNTVCAICGMKVDPSLPTMEYQGQTIGFGCKMCPPKFQAEPDKYGPSYLRNEIIKR